MLRLEISKSPIHSSRRSIYYFETLVALLTEERRRDTARDPSHLLTLSDWLISEAARCIWQHGWYGCAGHVCGSGSDALRRRIVFSVREFPHGSGTQVKRNLPQARNRLIVPDSAIMTGISDIAPSSDASLRAVFCLNGEKYERSCHTQ